MLSITIQGGESEKLFTRTTLPYVVVTLGDKANSTKHHPPQRSKVTWNEKLDFHFVQSTKVTIQVKDEKRSGMTLASADVDLTKVLEDGLLEGEVTLASFDGRSTATLTLRLQYYGHRSHSNGGRGSQGGHVPVPHRRSHGGSHGGHVAHPELPPKHAPPAGLEKHAAPLPPQPARAGHPVNLAMRNHSNPGHDHFPGKPMHPYFVPETK